MRHHVTNKKLEEEKMLCIRAASDVFVVLEELKTRGTNISQEDVDSYILYLNKANEEIDKLFKKLCRS